MAFRTLIAYQKAFHQAMEIFKISKEFPKVEQYSLTDQIRRSSRSVCANLAEAYRKRQYPPLFVSKISDGEMENSETSVWLEFALACEYFDMPHYKRLISLNDEVGKLLHHMRTHPEKYS